MRYRVTALTPTLVGGGAKLAPIDYMVWKDQVNVLDQNRIFRLLARGPRLEGYLTQLRKAERLDFATWGGFAQNFADRRVPFESSSAAAFLERARGESLFIPTFNSGPHGAFLPASALRGALRTATVFSRWTAGTIKDLTTRLDKDRIPRRPAESAESQAIGASYSNRFKLLSLADSSAVPASHFQVYMVRTSTLVEKGNKLELGWKIAPRGNVDGRRPDESTPVFAEMAKPGVSFEGIWQERAFYKDPQILEALRWREAPSRQVFFQAANRYSAALLEIHKQYADRAGLPLLAAEVARLQAKLESVRSSSEGCLLPLGWGGGLLSKSSFIETANEDYRAILKLVPLYSRAVSTGMPFPKTRKIVFLQDKPATLPGWTLLEVLDPADK